MTQPLPVTPLPRIVSIGFNKCGTRALAELFRGAGHRVIHHKVRDRWPVPRRIGQVMKDNLAAGRKVFDSVETYTFYCDLIINDGTTTWDGASAFRDILRDYPDTILLLISVTARPGSPRGSNMAMASLPNANWPRAGCMTQRR